MGFSPLEGLVMATRCGDLDPGLVTFLQRTEDLSPQDTENLMLAITPDTHVQNVKLNGGSDFGFAYLDKARFRVSVLRMQSLCRPGARSKVLP